MNVRIYYHDPDHAPALVSEGSATSKVHPQAFQDYVEALQEQYPEQWEKRLAAGPMPLALFMRGYTYEVVP